MTLPAPSRLAQPRNEGSSGGLGFGLSQSPLHAVAEAGFVAYISRKEAEERARCQTRRATLTTTSP